MGLFRLLLASTVMLGHFVAFYPQHLPYLMLAWASVPAFYMVSGFLITLVLRERYHDRVWLFYSNRALRLFPLYWAAFALFVLVNWFVAAGYLPGPQQHVGTNALRWWQAHGDEIGPLAKVLLVFSNLTIFGQDWILFIGKWPNIFTRDSFYHFFVYVGPAFTIDIEFVFYAIAPFVVLRHVRWTIAILVVSLLARWLAATHGFPEYANAYDFPPFEMSFFMAGSLAYRAYAYLRARNSRLITAYSYAACGTVALLSAFYLLIPFARPIYLLVASISLPGIVLLGRRNPLDNFLGELSYPIYLLHPLFTIFIIPGTTLWAELVAVTSTVCLSALLVIAVDRPIEAFRHRRVQRAEAGSAAERETAAAVPHSLAHRESA